MKMGEEDTFFTRFSSGDTTGKLTLPKSGRLYISTLI